MPKGNLLRELRSLSRKNKYPFAFSNDWEAWELCGDDPGKEDSWGFVEDGTLDDCLNALITIISLELDRDRREHIRHLSEKYDDDMEGFFRELEQLRSQRLKEIKEECLKNGRYEGTGWEIRSIYGAV